jgi:hypothetical protein
MTDEELVKRLRKGDTPMANHYMDEAADRIEALINLNEALVELMDDRDAKLAKAVAALQAFKDFDDMPARDKRPDVFEVSVRRKLLSTLAEIEGEKGCETNSPAPV